MERVYVCNMFNFWLGIELKLIIRLINLILSTLTMTYQTQFAYDTILILTLNCPLADCNFPNILWVNTIMFFQKSLNFHYSVLEQEKIVFTFHSVIAETGGTLGLFLGLSIMEIISFIGHGIMFCQKCSPTVKKYPIPSGNKWKFPPKS